MAVVKSGMRGDAALKTLVLQQRVAEIMLQLTEAVVDCCVISTSEKVGRWPVKRDSWTLDLDLPVAWLEEMLDHEVKLVEEAEQQGQKDALPGL